MLEYFTCDAAHAVAGGDIDDSTTDIAATICLLLLLLEVDMITAFCNCRCWY